MKEKKGKAESGQWEKRLDDISQAMKYCGYNKNKAQVTLLETQRACVLMMQNTIWIGDPP
jgi:hypothetical protein